MIGRCTSNPTYFQLFPTCYLHSHPNNNCRLLRLWITTKKVSRLITFIFGSGDIDLFNLKCPSSFLGYTFDSLTCEHSVNDACQIWSWWWRSVWTWLTWSLWITLRSLCTFRIILLLPKIWHTSVKHLYDQCCCGDLSEQYVCGIVRNTDWTCTKVFFCNIDCAWNCVILICKLFSSFSFTTTDLHVWDCLQNHRNREPSKGLSLWYISEWLYSIQLRARFWNYCLFFCFLDSVLITISAREDSSKSWVTLPVRVFIFDISVSLDLIKKYVSNFVNTLICQKRMGLLRVRTWFIFDVRWSPELLVKSTAERGARARDLSQPWTQLVARGGRFHRAQTKAATIRKLLWKGRTGVGDQKSCAHSSHFDIFWSLLRPYLSYVRRGWDCCVFAHDLFLASVALQSYFLKHSRTRCSSARPVPASDTIRGQSRQIPTSPTWQRLGSHHNNALT